MLIKRSHLSHEPNKPNLMPMFEEHTLYQRLNVNESNTFISLRLFVVNCLV